MDLKKYIYGHCIMPQKVKIFDAYTGTYSVRELPCGHCLHCRNTHVNEWTTRLYAQSKYSKHVYYITLDYAPFDLTSSVARQLAAETAACYHNINCTKNYGMHPLLLQKNHLQDFFKRFRRNTGIKIQYFACGEYGTHANGRGYGRPHFHIILFSDEVITPAMIVDAWTIHDYIIGRVDFHDLVANGSFDEINSKSKYNSKFVFKYVCKYLQKGSFDFESLATIDYHRTYFNTLQKYVAECDTLFPQEIAITDTKLLAQNWSDYVRNYSPFICCSKRPAIGLQYFEENCERFTQKDFRLFGLPKECVAFPSYYIRKTKEQMCDFVAIGAESFKASTSSRVGYILQVLREIDSMHNDFANFKEGIVKQWCKSPKESTLNLFVNGRYFCSIPYVNLHLYNTKYQVFYQFTGYGYNLWKKYNKIGFVKISYMDVHDVINQVQPKFDSFYDNFIRPMHDLRVIQEADLADSIRTHYNNSSDAYEKFVNEVNIRYQNELQSLYKTKLLTQNSKLTL